MAMAAVVVHSNRRRSPCEIIRSRILNELGQGTCCFDQMMKAAIVRRLLLLLLLLILRR